MNKREALVNKLTAAVKAGEIVELFVVCKRKDGTYTDAYETRDLEKMIRAVNAAKNCAKAKHIVKPHVWTEAVQ